MEVGGQRRAPGTLPARKTPTHCTGGWVGPRVGLDGCENLAPFGIRSADHPARRESMYRLSYRGPCGKSEYRAEMYNMEEGACVVFRRHET